MCFIAILIILSVIVLSIIYKRQSFTFQKQKDNFIKIEKVSEFLESIEKSKYMSFRISDMDGKHKSYRIKNLSQFKELFISFEDYADQELYMGFDSLNNLEILVFSDNKYESLLLWNMETGERAVENQENTIPLKKIEVSIIRYRSIR